MSGRLSGRLGVLVGALALGLIMLDILLIWTVKATPSAGDSAAGTVWMLSLAGAPLVGMLIAGRRPGHPYGWLLVSLGVSSALLETTELGALYLLESGRSDSFLALAGAVGTQPLWAATVAHIPLLLLLFPDGRLPSPGWRWLVRAVVGLAVVGGAAAMFIPGQLSVVPIVNPIGVSESWGALVNGIVIGAVVGIFVTMIPAAGSLFVRRRRATVQERLQLRWFSWAAAVTVAVFLLTGFAGIESDLVNNALAGTAFGALYAGIGIAVLRHRLYDIDRILSRTVSYTVLTALLLGLYLAAVTALTSITAPVTRQSPMAVAAATLLAASTFQPLRKRVQQGVDRRFNRSRYDAAVEVEAYRARLRDQLELETIGRDLAAVAASTVQPRSVVVWFQQEGAR